MKKTFLLLLGLATLFLYSCEDDKDVPNDVNEEELITELKLTLTESGTNNTIEFVAIASQGLEDGANTITQSAPLKAATTYDAEITLTNPDEDVTVEIEEEDDEHQLFFTATDGINITYNDEDENGNPTGLSTTIVTGTIATPASINIKLVHEPNKDAASAKAGTLDNTVGGVTELNVDIEINDIDENIPTTL